MAKRLLTKFRKEFPKTLKLVDCAFYVNTKCCYSLSVSGGGIVNDIPFNLNLSEFYERVRES